MGFKQGFGFGFGFWISLVVILLAISLLGAMLFGGIAATMLGGAYGG